MERLTLGDPDILLHFAPWWLRDLIANPQCQGALSEGWLPGQEAVASGSQPCGYSCWSLAQIMSYWDPAPWTQDTVLFQVRVLDLGFEPPGLP